MPFCLHIAGARALFMRPEFRNDQISYDLITPHAARGIFDAIYRRQGMTWIIDAIRVLRPIRHEIATVDGRRVAALCDVAYLVEAHFELASGEPAESGGRHSAMFKRALRAGATAHLGSAHYPGVARLADLSHADPPISADHDHGWLLHGPDFAGDRRMRFFRAIATAGRIAVPPPGSPLLFA